MLKPADILRVPAEIEEFQVVRSYSEGPRLPEDASAEQRVAEDRLRGADERMRYETVRDEFAALRAMEAAAAEVPLEDYLPMTNEAKAQIRAKMSEPFEEFAFDLRMSRYRDAPMGTSTTDWLAAVERQASRERYGVDAPIYWFHPSIGQWTGPLSAAPPGALKEAELVGVPADCQDLDGLLDRVRWSPQRPIRWADR